MDPAEEVLLDPVLVNLFFYPRAKKAIPVPLHRFESSGGVMPSAGERNVEERDEPLAGTDSQNARTR
jgi:hypothetical protein